VLVPQLVLLSDFPNSYDAYIDAIYQIFYEDLVLKERMFLNLPIKYPFHPSSQNKHSCFWHAMSEKGDTNKEEDRVISTERCARVRWISYIIENAMNRREVWCWEKSVKTKRGRSNHVQLYLHSQKYLVVLRRKTNRLEFVTAYTRNRDRMHKEYKTHLDPRQ